jgi:4-amino-4-deoxy-L-arabinose transferase-like glycosyltransferase
LKQVDDLAGTAVSKGHRGVALFLLLAALVLTALGQFYFFERPEYLWDGIVFHGAAVMCFLLAWRQVRAKEPRTSRRGPSAVGAWLREHPVQVGFIALGSIFSFVATLLAQGRGWDQPTGDAVIPWVLGLGAVGLAAAWPDSWPSRVRWDMAGRLRRASRQVWVEVATVVALTVLAFLLRATALYTVPYTLGGDEAWHGLLARQVLNGQLRNPFTMGYMSMPTFFYWPLSWSLWLVGDNMAGLRFPAVLAGTVTVPFLYFLARDLWGRRVAVLSALFLATYDYHIHYSRLGANNVWDPLFVLLALWALDRGLAGKQESGETGKAYRYFLAAGVATGLSFYFYTGARLLPVLMVVYTAFVWLKKRRQVPRLGLHLALLIAVFLIVAGPMLGYAMSHPDEWNARINQVGIIQSGWLAREPGLTGKSTLQILAEQFLRSAGAFHVFPDRTAWYGAERPLLGFLAGAFAVLGMAWAIAHWRERRHFLVLIWFWSVIITGGMLTESPPSSQRLVIAIPAVALLVAIGLEQTVRLAQRLLEPRWRGWPTVTLGLLVTILAVGSVRFYFVEFTPSGRYGSQNGETATMIGHYLHDLAGSQQAYFFGAPRIYWSFGTMSFLAPSVAGQDVVEPLTAPPDFVAAGRSSVFLFLPERMEELGWVQQAFPDGHLREFRDAGGSLRFVAYEYEP